MLLASVGQEFKTGRAGTAGLCSATSGTSAEKNLGPVLRHLKACSSCVWWLLWLSAGTSAGTVGWNACIWPLHVAAGAGGMEAEHEENQEKARKSSSGYNKNGSGLQGLGGETGMNRGPTEGF